MTNPLLMKESALFDYLLRLGDDRLVLGHRLSEWCGHAPILEEDIALANIALDCVGHASMLLKLAGQVEGRRRTEDDLAYFREAIAFRNVKLVEQPNGDFARTIARQFLFDAYSLPLYEELASSSHPVLAAISAKILKEVRYHWRHSSEWVCRLGDGTQESHARMQSALDELWTFTAELFESDDIESLLHKAGVVPLGSSLKPRWDELLRRVLSTATLTVPTANQFMLGGSRQGRHSEHLGHILSEMQILARSYPGASW